SSAEIILIDEILAVGDESFQVKCMDKIRDLKKNNKTVLIVSHNKKKMEELTDRILFIKGGEIISS
ncbi:MAG TPA: ABC transporter ATP-binding protein, partial [Thermodesulfobacteriota bacterium]|nr:ABC transporter ATP-binding protein [Thermodesulfobacteriota bacterium]